MVENTLEHVKYAFIVIKINIVDFMKQIKEKTRGKESKSVTSD